jgi:hypothetical protein
MAELKLGKLPDRTPVKLTISISPDLNRALGEYARAYEEAYGDAEPPAELVPAMLETFLANDRAFARMRKRSNEPRG